MPNIPGPRDGLGVAVIIPLKQRPPLPPIREQHEFCRSLGPPDRVEAPAECIFHFHFEPVRAWSGALEHAAHALGNRGYLAVTENIAADNLGFATPECVPGQQMPPGPFVGSGPAVAAGVVLSRKRGPCDPSGSRSSPPRSASPRARRCLDAARLFEVEIEGAHRCTRRVRRDLVRRVRWG